jgi:hypothetical protein
MTSRRSFRERRGTGVRLQPTSSCSGRTSTGGRFHRGLVGDPPPARDPFAPRTTTSPPTPARIFDLEACRGGRPAALGRPPPPPAAAPPPGDAPRPGRALHPRRVDLEFADRRCSPQPGRPPCQRSVLPVIHWDGRVTLCYQDTHLDLVVGNGDSSFRDIWLTGAPVARHRRLQMEGRFHVGRLRPVRNRFRRNRRGRPRRRARRDRAPDLLDPHVARMGGGSRNGYAAVAAAGPGPGTEARME